MDVFREIYCTTGRTGFDLKSTFHIVFKTYKDKKIEQLGKNSQNYKNAHAETSVSEQKPMKIDDFNEAEEKEVKERIEKGKMKRREVAEKNKLLKKRKKKQEKNKEDEKEMWSKLKELNKEFKDISEHKKTHTHTHKKVKNNS